MKTNIFLLLPTLLPLGAWAQIDYSGGNYKQDFNSLDSGVIYRNYTSLPAGWAVSHGSYVWTTVTNGYSNNYGTYCFSTAANDPDKALGLVIGSTGPASFGARFRNNTGATLTAFSLSYFAEQWAKGGVTGSDQVIPFAYSLDATSLTSGTYVNVTALDMHSINDGDGVFAALNGNAGANRQMVASTVSGISWLPGQDLWIRWTGVSHPFNASHALAVDDLVFRAVAELSISPGSPGTFELAWATNYTGYVLESALAPTSANWDAVTNVSTTSNGAFRVQMEASNAARFFRLRIQ